VNFSSRWLLTTLDLTSLITLWILLVSTVHFVALTPGWYSYKRILTHGRSTTALILALPPDDHDFVTYEYHANGHLYTGSGWLWPPNPDYDEVHVGQQVTAYYDVNNPASAVLGDPICAFDNENVSILIPSVFFSTVVVVFLWHRTKRIGLLKSLHIIR